MNTPISVVITGASDGIGKAMALEFARTKARIGLIARRKDLLDALVPELRSAGSPEVRIAALDVTDFAAQRTALDSFDTAFHGISHLVLNAGISSRSRPWEDSWEDIHRCLDVNLLAALNAAEWMKPRMVARRRGTIAGVSSIAAVRGLPDSGAYSTSKAALSTYLESLRVDLEPYGVKIVIVTPGFIRTALTTKNHGTMPFLMDVNEAGRIFTRGVLRANRRVIAPWPYRGLQALLRLMPDSIYDFLIRRYMRKIRGDTPESRLASKS